MVTPNKKRKKKSFSKFEQALYNFTRGLDPESYKKVQLARFKKLIQESQPNQFDKQLGLRFRRIVHRHRKENPGQTTYFKFKFIEELGLPDIDLLLLYTGKNIGKTYALGELATQTIAEDKSARIFYMRSMRDHLARGFNAQNTDTVGPGTGHSSTGELTLKKGHGIEREKRRKKGDLVGWATYLSGDGPTSFQGSSYEGLKYLFWDECNDVGGMTQGMLDAFLVFLLSLERNNEEFKTIMTGNLLARTTGIARNLILECFGIPMETKLRYIEVPREDIPENAGKPPFRFLYINGGQPGELFDGSKSQKFNALLQLTGRGYLVDNTPHDMSEKVVDMANFLDGDPIGAQLLKIKYDEDTEGFYVMYVSQQVIQTGMKKAYYYIIHIDRYEYICPLYGYTIFSDNKRYINSLEKVSFVSKERIAMFGNRLGRMFEARRVFYSDSKTRDICESEIFTRLEEHYEKVLENDELYVSY